MAHISIPSWLWVPHISLFGDVGWITTSPTGSPETLAANGLNESYSYDAFGNMQQGGNFSFEQSYNAANQLVGYAYDAAGNLLSDNLFNTLAYDAESRVAWDNGATYIYDAEGNRVEKQGSAAEDTIYFGGQPVARYAGGGRTDLIYGPTGLLAEVPGTAAGQPVYRVTDNLGTTAGSLLANGTFVNPIDHAPFGQVFTGTTNDPYFFTGKERDQESGLDYFGARYYSSSMGRFSSPDPSGLLAANPADPQSWNMYAYARNNPLINIDPTGLDCVYANDAGNGVESIDHDSNSGECGQNGGTWAPGYVDENWANYNGKTGMFQVGSIDGSGSGATVDYTNFQAGAQTDANGNCLSGCGGYGFASANANWLQGQLVGNSMESGLDGYLTFLTGRVDPIHGMFGSSDPGLGMQILSGPLAFWQDNWAGPGGMGVPSGQGDWAASVHDYNFQTNNITLGTYFNPTVSAATARALIQSDNNLIRNAGGFQGAKMGLFFGVVNAFQWMAHAF